MLLSPIVMSLLIIGHRGASGHAPENTLPAFEKAIEMGADGIELDVWPAVDGTPMVIHDDALERTHGHQGRVSAMQAGELADLGIPRYEDVLALAKDRLVVFTELKGGHEDVVAGLIHRAVAQDGRTYGELPVIGFDHEQLRRLKKTHPAILTGATFSQRMLERVPAAQQAEYMITRAQDIGAAAINPQYHLVTAELVERAHAAGLQVNVWTVNTPGTMRKLIALGVDSIMTDYPDRLHRIVHEAGSGD